MTTRADLERGVGEILIDESALQSRDTAVRVAEPQGAAVIRHRDNRGSSRQSADITVLGPLAVEVTKYSLGNYGHPYRSAAVAYQCLNRLSAQVRWQRCEYDPTTLDMSELA